MLHLTPTAKSLVTYCIVYPFVMRALYLIRQSFEPFYMNSTCLIDLVRFSSPEHYDLHPLWKFYQQASNETCESLTGIPIKQYFNETYAAGIFCPPYPNVLMPSPVHPSLLHLYRYDRVQHFLLPGLPVLRHRPGPIRP
jgi:hypothetical protein